MSTLCLLVSLLITFANILDPDQARQYVGPDLDPKRFDSDGVPERICEKDDSEKISRRQNA